MNLHDLSNIGIGIAVLVWVGYRQTTWRPVNAGKMWRLPVILGIVAIASLVGAKVAVTGVDVAVLAIELLISAATGLWMGTLAHFRPTGSGRWESRTGWLGLALWLLVIAIRIGTDVLAVHLGAALVTSTGTILLLVATNRLVRVAVVLVRAGRLETPAPAPVRGKILM